ncbi:MAG: hypothetical protein Q7J35_10750 [Candidatus Methanoperedens sp.]|nr:hypothetical protein [Candidatus Methanoperedens sp.]
MGYTSGAKTLYEILDKICAGLLSSTGGNWTDGDTTWNTSDKSIANNGRRCMLFQKNGEVTYWAIEVVNETSGAYFYYNYYGKGLRFTASKTWENHSYPVSNVQSFCPFEIHGGGVGTNMATLQVTYYLWIDPDGNGFAILMKPEPTGSNTQNSMFLVLERSDLKEYSDGQSSFYLLNIGNVWQGIIYSTYDVGYPNIRLWRTILRPWAYQYPDGTATRITCYPNGNGVSMVANPSYYAFKSTQNSKVYYVKPIIHNAANQLAPIFQAELWFPWSEGVGLVDGDVIAIEGSSSKFLCKAVDSPDSTNRLCYAIKYENVV